MHLATDAIIVGFTGFWIRNYVFCTLNCLKAHTQLSQSVFHVFCSP